MVESGRWFTERFRPIHRYLKQNHWHERRNWTLRGIVKYSIILFFETQRTQPFLSWRESPMLICILLYVDCLLFKDMCSVIMIPSTFVSPHPTIQSCGEWPCKLLWPSFGNIALDHLSGDRLQQHLSLAQAFVTVIQRTDGNHIIRWNLQRL